MGINRFVSDMLTILYSQEEMMTSSYTGKRGNRNLIEQTRMNYIKSMHVHVILISLKSFIN